MRYVKARWAQAQRDLAYQTYVTDSLQCIAENTTHIGGFNGITDYGKSMQTRWVDIVFPSEPIEEDPRSCEEITMEIWGRIRGGATGGS